MKLIAWASGIKNALRRDIFPPEFSFFLEFPWRNIVLSPEKLVSRLALAAENRVLEVGAGSGFYSAAAARQLTVGQFEILDLQPRMLKKTRAKLKELSNVGYTAADAAELPFKNESFDVVFLVTVFGEISNRTGFLQEARRILKPNGILSISEHLPDPDFLSSATVKSLVEKEDFKFFEHFGSRWNYTVNFRKANQTDSKNREIL